MRLHFIPVRCAAGTLPVSAAFLLAVLLFAVATLCVPKAVAQAAAPTATTSPTAASAAMPTTAHASDVRYAEGLLTVSANNAGLNSLLREIAQRTGMHVSGSVREDRVFGTYGPAEPSRVISLLLDGTGTNVLLVQAADDRPRELVLTRRTGGATPPDPNAAAARDEADDPSGDDEAPIANLPMRRGGGARNAVPNSAPGYRPPNSGDSAQQAVGGPDHNPAAPNGSPSSTEQPVVFAPVDATTAPATGTSSPADNVDSTPKDAKTPQQIFEELQRLRQQPPAGTTPQ